MPGSLLIDLQVFLVTMALVVPRALTCLVIFPGLGLRSLSGMLRNSVAFAIALPAAFPTYEFVQQTPPGLMLATVLAMKEAAIGLMLGVLMSIPIWVAQSVGSIVDVQRLPIQSQANNASVDQDASVIGALLLQAVVLVMIQAGLLVALIRIIIESYGVWPVFSLAPPFETGHLDVLVRRFGELMWHVVVYGGPVIIPMLLIDLAFAIIGIFAPNLQVSFASSPVKSIVGVFVLLLYWPTLSHYVAGDFSHILDLAAELFHLASRH